MSSNLLAKKMHDSPKITISLFSNSFPSFNIKLSNNSTDLKNTRSLLNFLNYLIFK